VLPLLLGLGVGTLESTVALAATPIALAALAFAPRLLPVSAALFAAGIVLPVYQGDLDEWSVPPLAAALLLLVESAELRHRLPRNCTIERNAFRAQVRQLASVVAAGIFASAVAVASASLSSRGGAGAGLVGAAAIVATLALVRSLARSGTSTADLR